MSLQHSRHYHACSTEACPICEHVLVIMYPVHHHHTISVGRLAFFGSFVTETDTPPSMNRKGL